MGFADKQLRRLQAPLKPQHIKSREAEGVILHYLEGWHVLAEANRIFGFDGWDREMVACQCVWTKQLGQPLYRRLCGAGAHHCARRRNPHHPRRLGRRRGYRPDAR